MKNKAKRNGKWVEVDPQIERWRKRGKRKDEPALDDDADFKARRQAVLDFRDALIQGLETDDDEHN